MSPWLPSNGIFSGRPLQRGERVVIAVLIGLGAGIAAFLAFQKMPMMLARDFTFPWRGARALLEGSDPYVVIRPVGPSPFNMWFMYPLAAAMAVVPLALLDVQIAGALFVAIGASLLAFVMARDGLGRMWLFLSAPFGLATALGQWSPLLMAAALATPLSWALTCKPTIGAALFLYRPSWRSFAICSAFVLLAFAIEPRWLTEWLHTSGTVREHFSPVARPWGAIPLLALLRWRRPEARLVAAMALVPQNLYFYDQLPLWFVARTGTSSLILTVASWVAWAGTRSHCPDPFFCGPQAEPWVISLIYLPATAIVLIDRESLTWIRNSTDRLLGRERSDDAGLRPSE
jgi:hypothetical protein